LTYSQLVTRNERYGIGKNKLYTWIMSYKTGEGVKGGGVLTYSQLVTRNKRYGWVRIQSIYIDNELDIYSENLLAK
jgi:hypothetical protein